jgi:hypothetical protein
LLIALKPLAGISALELTSKRILLRLFVAALTGLTLHHSFAGGRWFMVEEALARGWENLVDRLGGPMSFRVLMQPAMAIFFAVLAGVKDARQNNPTFLGCAISNPGSWRARMRLSWKDVGTVFIVAVILDAIYQVTVHSGIFALELLITATVLALVPYMVFRDLVARVARWVGVGKPAEGSIAKDE